MNQRSDMPAATPKETRLEDLRVWLVHDWLTGMRGGEKVLLELVGMFPQARIATLLHVPGTTHAEIDKRVKATSFLQKMPGAERHYRNYLPLFPRAIRSLKLEGPCDLVISVSHAVAKGVRVPPNERGKAAHVCYCNTPMRYIWGMEDHYLSKRSPKRAALALATPGLRRFDLKNERVTQFVANSRNVAERIARIYKREATVVYPGIDEHYFVPGAAAARESFYLVVSALVPYKRVDLAVRAFVDRGGPGRRLVVIGSGPELARLRAMAGSRPHIEILGRQPDGVILDHYQRCRGFLFPGEEDFGLTPVEAQACGAPVIAYRAGGALETVVEGETGVFFDQQEAGALNDAVDRLEAAPGMAPERLRKNALNFTMRKFRAGIAEVVSKVVG